MGGRALEPLSRSSPTRATATIKRVLDHSGTPCGGSLDGVSSVAGSVICPGVEPQSPVPPWVRVIVMVSPLMLVTSPFAFWRPGFAPQSNLKSDAPGGIADGNVKVTLTVDPGRTSCTVNVQYPNPAE